MKCSLISKVNKFFTAHNSSPDLAVNAESAASPWDSVGLKRPGQRCGAVYLGCFNDNVYSANISLVAQQLINCKLFICISVKYGGP